jgi:hypothetical protein
MGASLSEDVSAMQTSMLVGSGYSPSRGGHAPGDLREAFGDAVDAFEAWGGGDPGPTIEVRGGRLTVSAICGLLWNCSDVMPPAKSQQLNDLTKWPQDRLRSNTYAAGARLLKSLTTRSHQAV